jgi:hypothetical protein
MARESVVRVWWSVGRPKEWRGEAKALNRRSAPERGVFLSTRLFEARASANVSRLHLDRSNVQPNMIDELDVGVVTV